MQLARATRVLVYQALPTYRRLYHGQKARNLCHNQAKIVLILFIYPIELIHIFKSDTSSFLRATGSMIVLFDGKGTINIWKITHLDLFFNTRRKQCIKGGGVRDK